tara:strand:- start:1244 stop:1507 length:264 start_codon:yes stop_codon:yes gene_type:complete
MENFFLMQYEIERKRDLARQEERRQDRIDAEKRRKEERQERFDLEKQARERWEKEMELSKMKMEQDRQLMMLLFASKQKEEKENIGK